MEVLDVKPAEMDWRAETNQETTIREGRNATTHFQFARSIQVTSVHGQETRTLLSQSTDSKTPDYLALNVPRILHSTELL